MDTSSGFDAAWYVSRYPELGLDGDTAPGHYATLGWREGRFPNALFDTYYYLARYTDVAASGENPLAHYMRDGASQSRAPNPWFDPGHYLARVADPAAAANPMLYYLESDASPLTETSAAFDVADYARLYPELTRPGSKALAHFLHNPQTAAEGWIDECTSTYVSGWSARKVGPPVTLTIRVNGVVQGQVVPWIRRAGLGAHGFPEIAGFTFSFSRRLASGDIVEALDERLAPLNGSPKLYEIKPLEKSSHFKEARASIAAMFLRGAGLEIGAYTQPNDLPPGLSVEYYDKFPAEVVRGYYDETWGRPLAEPHYHGNAELLEGLPKGKTFDFIIANHVIEHMEDPIRFLKSVAGALAPAGRALIAAPDKRFTFDRARDLTTFEHLVDDHNGGAAANRFPHYLEYVAKVDGVIAEDAFRYAEKLAREDFSIHFHAWDETTFVNFVTRSIIEMKISLSLIFTYSVNGEVIVVLERS